MALLDAHGLATVPRVNWLGILPSVAGMNGLLRASRNGHPPRRWFTPVEHPELETTITYAGPPYRFSETPWRIHRPPRIGEHNQEVYCGELGLSKKQLAALTDAGII